MLQRLAGQPQQLEHLGKGEHFAVRVWRCQAGLWRHAWLALRGAVRAQAAFVLASSTNKQEGGFE